MPLINWHNRTDGWLWHDRYEKIPGAIGEQLPAATQLFSASFKVSVFSDNPYGVKLHTPLASPERPKCAIQDAVKQPYSPHPESDTVTRR